MGEAKKAARGLVLVWLVSQTVTGLPGWRPAPGVYHDDHNDDHVGYALTVRLHTLNPGYTYMQAAQAVDNYLYQVSTRDDVVELYGFWDTAHSIYVTTGTWRTAQGALDSYNYAVSVTTGPFPGNYLTTLTEVAYYAGTVNAFQEYLEFHSTPEGGYVTAVELCKLGNPAVWNQATMIPYIDNTTIPSVVSPGVLDYSVCFPTLPTSGSIYFTQSTWNHTADAQAGLAAIQNDFNTLFGGNVLVNCTVYTDTILNFWHSAPGVTPAWSGTAALQPGGGLLSALALLAVATSVAS